MSNHATADGATRSLIEAAEVMWKYYKANKPSLVPDIRTYREYILERLMAGQTDVEVFAQFMRADPVPKCNANVRKQGTLRNRASLCRPPWPFSKT
jgi:hypothetical protein